MVSTRTKFWTTIEYNCPKLYYRLDLASILQVILDCELSGTIYSIRGPIRLLCYPPIMPPLNHHWGPCNCFAKHKQFWFFIVSCKNTSSKLRVLMFRLTLLSLPKILLSFSFFFLISDKLWSHLVVEKPLFAKVKQFIPLEPKERKNNWAANTYKSFQKHDAMNHLLI